MSDALKYRPEIDGLRALAVVAVIVFHFHAHFLPGGFLGVDVFFVISGFLITSIIHRQLDDGTFSLRSFWMRRIRRLYPALFFMVGIVALLGYLLILRPERGELTLHSIAALCSFQNILLWKTTGGYWAESSENIALLHTWSLSLEEQFYLVFPPVLLLVHRFARRWILPVIVGMAVVSVLLCLQQTEVRRNAAFYFLPTRMWELLLGSIAAIVLSGGSVKRGAFRFGGVISALGVVMIVASFLTIPNDENFPGIRPLLPCAGAVAVLLFGNSKGIAHGMLANGAVTYIGKISYSLYLWHWPVLVLYRYVSLESRIVLLAVIMLALAMASYHWVETPMRRSFPGSWKLLVTMPALVGLCLLPIRFGSESPILPKAVAGIDSPESFSRGWEFESTEQLRKGEPGVYRGEPNRPLAFAIAGSSHARVLSSPLAAYASETHCRALFCNTSGLGMFTLGGARGRPGIEAIDSNRFEQLQTVAPPTLLVAGMWANEAKEPEFDSAFIQRIRALATRSKKIYVLSQVPMIALPEEYSGAVRRYFLAQAHDGPLHAESSSQVLAANEKIRDLVARTGRSNVEFVDIYHCLCLPDGTVRISEDGRWLYSDHNHLNDTGAKYVFDHVLRPLLEQARAESVTAVTHSSADKNPSSAL